MRSEILRDVIAGCAGVLAVAALIGVPGHQNATQQPQLQFGRTQLLPYYRMVHPPIPVPAVPHPRFTARP